jgi:predicted  nucleic acid-binding Zn-ribbon protein
MSESLFKGNRMRSYKSLTGQDMIWGRMDYKEYNVDEMNAKIRDIKENIKALENMAKHAKLNQDRETWERAQADIISENHRIDALLERISALSGNKCISTYANSKRRRKANINLNFKI